jgi:predicted RNA-binding protein YlxR (DUF448 family)
MASLNEAFSFPLTQKIVEDIENTQTNIPGRGSYVSLSKETNTYKQNSSESDLKMYNSLKEQPHFK